MKSKVIVAIVLSAVALMAGDKTTSSRSESFSISKDERHHTLTFTNFEAESEYSVSVGASGGKLVSASAPSGIMVTPTDQSELFSSATATKTAGTLPDSFNFVFSGYFRPDGDADAGSDLPWDVEVGTKFYWIEASGYDEKDITVPEGTTVQYVARENGDSKKSNWTVSMSGGASQSKSEAASITFNRSFWGDIAAWFTSDQAVTTPVPGIYTITAVPSDNTSFSPAPSATMRVVGGEFKEHSSHAYGFDDYTNWNKNAADYYGAKTGRCTLLPYASVKSGYQGHSNFVLTPSISRDIEFFSSENRLLFSPSTTKSTVEITFEAASGWFSSATLSAKLSNDTLAQLEVNSFDQTSKQMLIVLVAPNVSTTVTAPAGTSSTTLNKVFQQVVLNINCSTDTFIYSAAPNVWGSSDRMSLKNAFISSPPPGISIDDYDHIIFVIAGSDSESALAWGEVGGKFMWIYTSTNRKYVVAHELGHNYGLRDQYTYNNGNVTPGDDLYNLMNSVISSIHHEQFRLRKSQWTTIK